ncbi:MAG: hypothetical protein AMXMBFR84_49950 [Candidatus Hydrogenedentota bacterium]
MQYEGPGSCDWDHTNAARNTAVWQVGTAPGAGPCGADGVNKSSGQLSNNQTYGELIHY